MGHDMQKPRLWTTGASLRSGCGRVGQASKPWPFAPGSQDRLRPARQRAPPAYLFTTDPEWLGLLPAAPMRAWERWTSLFKRSLTPAYARARYSRSPKG